MIADFIECLPSKNKIISWINMASAFCAFWAAFIWVLSGGLGEIALDMSNVNMLQPVAKGAAQFNTMAAKWALASALFVMLSSLVSIAMKEDNVREQEKMERRAKEDAQIEKFILEQQNEKSNIDNVRCEAAEASDVKGSKLALAAIIIISLLPYTRKDKN